MTDSLTFSDAALARAFDIYSPDDVAALRQVLDDPESEFVLTAAPVTDDDDPDLIVSYADTEVQRIIDTYGTRGDRPVVQLSALSASDQAEVDRLLGAHAVERPSFAPDDELTNEQTIAAIVRRHGIGRP